MQDTSCAFLLKPSLSNFKFHACAILKRRHPPSTQYPQISRQCWEGYDCVGGGVINRVSACWDKMASALFKAITAIGLNSAAFLQSRFLFSFDTLLQAVKNLSNTGQTNQPTLPCSTSGSPSGSPSGPPSESPASAKEQNDEGDHGSDNTTDMAGAPSSSTASAPRGRQPSVSTTVPARPRIPPTKENGPPPKAPPSDSQLTDGLSRLDLNGTGATSAPLAASHQAVVNGTGVLAEKENGAGVVPNGVSAQPSGPGAGNGIAAGHAPRILPVPQIKSVSQTGEAKETTTIQLDGETVEILAKVETPEQAAERAIHSRFMREALDMVSRSIFPVLEKVMSLLRYLRRGRPPILR